MKAQMGMAVKMLSFSIDRWICLTTISACILQGCFGSESEPPPFPPLSPVEVVGCWRIQQSSVNTCAVDCYDSAGAYFRAFRSDASLPILAEDSGHYRITGNEIFHEYRLKNNQGSNVQSSFRIEFAMIGGKLMNIQNGQLTGVELSRVHPDSFPCGLKPWTLFQKPATWTLF